MQGLGQLDDLYGRAGREAILQNLALQVFFAANDEMTARKDFGPLLSAPERALESRGRSRGYSEFPEAVDEPLGLVSVSFSSHEAAEVRQ